MKIVIAPQGFKGNLTALQVGRAIEVGVKRVAPDATTVVKPMADGGDGTLHTLVDACDGKIKVTMVTGPFGQPVTAEWGILSDGTAIIEMASASGLTLIRPDDRNPLTATTYGTGELIRAALDSGCRNIIIGIGGSATNDGGAGTAQALGARLLDSRGDNIPFGGAALSELERIDIAGLDPRLAECTTLVACDVDNPLCGPCGASAVYGPQKGATPEMVTRLDATLSHYADIVRRDLGIDVRHTLGSGAAGGLGMGLMVFLKAKLEPGIDIVIRCTGLAKDLADADLVFTAEGRIDGQTACGKVPIGVARKAKNFGLPVIALAGEIGEDHRVVYQHGIDAVLSIAPGPITLARSMAEGEKLLANAAECAMRLWGCSGKVRFTSR